MSDIYRPRFDWRLADEQPPKGHGYVRIEVWDLWMGKLSNTFAVDWGLPHEVVAAKHISNREVSNFKMWAYEQKQIALNQSTRAIKAQSSAAARKRLQRMSRRSRR
jgi:hypothetical protein